jgi:hypothetical protein
MFKATKLAPVMALTLALGLPVTGCKKEGGSTAGPGDAGKKQEAGVSLRYDKKAKTLKQNTTVGIKVSGGGQYGELNMTLEATLNLADAQNDKVEVGWKIDAVDSLELKGMLKPKEEEGKPAPVDPKTTLVEKGNGAWVMDLRGEADKEATKALPVNAKKREEQERKKKEREEKKKKGKDGDKGEDGGPTPEPGEQLLAYMEGIFQLPHLPEKNMEVGKPLVIEEEEEAPLGGEDGGGPVLPIESETIYTLIKVDDSGDKRIAEYQVEVEASGATEFQGGMLVVDVSREATVLFNIDDGVPVRVEVTSTQAFSMGDQGSEFTTIIESDFEQG